MSGFQERGVSENVSWFSLTKNRQKMGVFASVFFLFREAVLQENLLEDARVRGRLDTGHWDTGAVI